MTKSVNTQTFSQDRRSTRLRSRYGPWAVITGASSGIGRELAVSLGQAGLNLVLVARSRDSLAELANEMNSRHGVETRVIAADLAQQQGIAAIERGTNDLEVGLLVASAGFGTSGSFLESSLDRELEMLDVNCRALFQLTWHFGHLFAERGRGGIILMSSIVGLQGMPYAAHYAATKAYVQTLAEALYLELIPKGVDVLASAPGPTNSGFATRANMKMGAALSPVAVAQPTLDALGRRATVLPGFLSKLLVYSTSMLPRNLRVRIMGNVMYGMTKHQQVVQQPAGSDA